MSRASFRIILVLSAGALWPAAPDARAQTLVVPDAFKTIQAAIDAASDGDVVAIKDGVYAGEGNRNIDFNGKKIKVGSRNGRGVVIDCGGAGRGFNFHSGEGPGSVLDGVTIVNGSADDNGGGILCTGSGPTIAHAVIIGNSTRGSGGGICIVKGSPRITSCVIAGNTSRGAGGGICCRGSDAALVNCTIADNAGAGIYADTGSLSLVNCIVWGAAERAKIALGPAANVSVSSCNVQGGQAGVSVPKEGGLFWGGWNIETDPRFVLPGDYHLPAESPCVDAGCNPPGDLTPTDADGNARSLDGLQAGMARIDIGAYERNAKAASIAISPAFVNFFARQGGPNPYGEALSIANCGGGTLQWEIAEDAPWLKAVPTSGRGAYKVALKAQTANLAHGKYSCILKVSDPGAANTPRVVIVTLHVNAVINVPAEYPTIQAAIDAAMTGDTILVADGTYKGPGNREIDFLGKAVVLKSKNGPNKSIIDCESAGRGVYFRHGEGPGAVLEGFTITNGSVPASWPGLSVGGGIVCDAASPTIVRNIIAGNRGSGICCGAGASPVIKSNFIVGNIADWGGCGIYCDASAPATIANNTIASNPGGGVRAWGSAATVTNCIIWGNGEDVGGVSPTFSCVQDECKGVGNKSAYPWFVDPALGDYRLRSYSPCIDSGTDSAVLPEDRDIDGYPRSALLRVDIGAHERPEKSHDAENSGLGDDLPDDWEKEHFGSNRASKWDDPDNDGLTNIDEFKAGTDPNLDQRTVYVSAANANDPKPDGTRAHPFHTLQHGIDAATKKVLVAEGWYIERVTVDGKTLDVEGGYDKTFAVREPRLHPTVLDARGLYRAVTFVGGVGGSLSGFTITGGNAYHGGGVCCALSSPTISDNIFTGNEAQCGGAIECGWNSAPIIRDNTIFGNRAAHYGGGIYLWAGATAAMSGNVIAANSAGDGGGAVHCAGKSAALLAGSSLWGNNAAAPEIGLAENSSLLVIDSSVPGGTAQAQAADDCTLIWGIGNYDPTSLAVGAENEGTTP